MVANPGARTLTLIALLVALAVANAGYVFCSGNGECPDGVHQMSCNSDACYAAAPQSGSYSVKYSKDFVTWRDAKDVHGRPLESVSAMSSGHVLAAGIPMLHGHSSFLATGASASFNGVIDDTSNIYAATEFSDAPSSAFFIMLYARPGTGVITTDLSGASTKAPFPADFVTKYGLVNAVAASTPVTWFAITSRYDVNRAAARATARGCLMSLGQACRLGHGLDMPTLRFHNARTAGRLAAALGTNVGVTDDHSTETSFLVWTSNGGKTWKMVHQFEKGVSATALHCRGVNCHVATAVDDQHVAIYKFAGSAGTKLERVFSAKYPYGQVTSIGTTSGPSASEAVFASLARTSFDSPSSAGVASYCPKAKKWGMQPYHDAIGFYSVSAVNLRGNETAYFAGVTDREVTVILSVSADEDLSRFQGESDVWVPYY